MGRGFERSMKDQAARDEFLSAYLDDQLDAEDCARLEAQLAADPALRAELETLRHTVALVRDLPPQPVPRNFILPQTVAAPKTRPAPRLRPKWLAPFLTAATAAITLLFVAVLAGDLFFFGVGGMAQLAAPSADEVAVESAPVEREAEKEEAPKMLTITESPEEEAPPGLEAEETQVPNAEAPADSSLQPTPLPEAPGATQEPGDGEGRYTDLTPEAEGSPTPEGIGGGSEPPTESLAPTPTSTTDEVQGAAVPTDAPEAEATVPAPVPLPATGEPSEPGLHDTLPAPDDVIETEPPSPTSGGGGDWGRAVLPAGTTLRVVEIALGVTALLLALAMVWAWRARRR
jgi:hypothetical protein